MGLIADALFTVIITTTVFVSVKDIIIIDDLIQTVFSSKKDSKVLMRARY